MAKRIIPLPANQQVLYENVITSKFGDLPVRIMGDVREKVQSYQAHLSKRRMLRELSSDTMVQSQNRKNYEQDYFVKQYLERGMPFERAIANAQKDYEYISQDATVWSLLVIMVENIFQITFTDQFKSTTLKDIDFEFDESFFNDSSNASREEFDDPLIPAYDKTSIPEQRIAHLKQMCKLDKNLFNKLQEISQEAFSVLQKDTTEVDENGFRPE